MSTPLDYRAEEGLNPRVLEKEQLIQLCNILAEELLIGRYSTEIGTYRIENKIAEGKDKDITDDHLAAYRIFKEEIMYISGFFRYNKSALRRLQSALQVVMLFSDRLEQLLRRQHRSAAQNLPGSSSGVPRR